MVWMLIAITVVALLLLVIAKKKGAPDAASDYSYKKIPALFTPAERSFLGVLDQAVGKDFRLFGKVRVADVLAPQDGLSKSVWQTAFNKINRKHFDFVLCAPGDLSVLCAIELDDKSHNKKDRQDRDEFLAAACLTAGLPLISFKAQQAYSAVDVSARIAEAISGKSMRSPQPVDSDVASNVLRKEPALAPEESNALTCPRCSSAMIKRTAKGGENAGREFWGCSNFPACREIVTI